MEHSVHSIWHFLREATEDLTHADSRLWRTIAALLFKPGFLTREFLDGRRARYLPPVRLYLVLSVLFFLTAGSGAVQLPPSAEGADVSAHGRVVLPGTAGCGWTDYHGAGSSWLAPMLRASCEKVAADRGRALDEQFNHTLPRALFVFLPVFALLMKALYRRPPRYYVEHLLFFIHDHAAAFLLMSLAWLVGALRAPQVLVGPVNLVVGIYLPVYLFQSLRRMYGQGVALTLVKFVGLALAYLVLGSLTMALVAVYSYLTL